MTNPAPVELHLVRAHSMFASAARIVRVADNLRSSAQRAFPELAALPHAYFFDVTDTRGCTRRRRLVTSSDLRFMQENGARNHAGVLIVYAVETVVLSHDDRPVPAAPCVDPRVLGANTPMHFDFAELPAHDGGAGGDERISAVAEIAKVVGAAADADSEAPPTPNFLRAAAVAANTLMAATVSSPSVVVETAAATPKTETAPRNPPPDSMCVDAKCITSWPNALALLSSLEPGSDAAGDLTGSAWLVKRDWLAAHVQCVVDDLHWTSARGSGHRALLMRCLACMPVTPAARPDRTRRLMYTLATLVLDAALNGRSTLIASPWHSGTSFAALCAAWILRFHTCVNGSATHVAAVAGATSAAPSVAPANPKKEEKEDDGHGAIDDASLPGVFLLVADESRAVRLRAQYAEMSRNNLPACDAAAVRPGAKIVVVTRALADSIRAWRALWPERACVFVVDDAWAMTSGQLDQLFELHMQCHCVVWTGVRDTLRQTVSLLDLFHTQPVFAVDDASVHVVHQHLRDERGQINGLTRLTRFALGDPTPREFHLALDGQVHALHALDSARTVHDVRSLAATCVVWMTNVRLQARASPFAPSEPAAAAAGTHFRCDAPDGRELLLLQKSLAISLALMRMHTPTAAITPLQHSSDRVLRVLIA